MASFFQFLINLFRPSLGEDVKNSASFAAAAGSGDGAEDKDGAVMAALAVISGDSGGQVGTQIAGQIKSVSELGMKRLDKPAPNEKGPDLFGKILRSHNAATAAAGKAQADLMLWGEIDSENKLVRLRVSSAGSNWAERVAMAAIGVDLPDPVPGYLSPLFAAWLLTNALGVVGRHEDRIAMQGALNGWMPKLRAMIRDDGDAVPSAEMASLAAVYGLAAAELARDGIRGHLADAASVIQLATARSVGEPDQLRHAGLLALQGDLLIRRAMSSAGDEDLEIAKDSFVRAEEIFRGYGSAAPAAAFCHFGLGRALVLEGKGEDDLGKLVSGLAELRAGVTSLTSAKDGYQWSMVMAELGRGMSSQAELEGRKTAFKQAIEVLQAARKVMPRMRLYDFGQLCYSLGSAQYLYGKMAAEAEQLQQAKIAFGEAADSFTKYGAHRSARSAEGNMHRCDQATEDAAAMAERRAAAEAEEAEAAAAAADDVPKG